MQQYYDIIGDVHGCADELEVLLKKLGYDNAGGIYRHPEGRKVIFLGDFIDRGLKIRETLQIAKTMYDAGSAFAVMGNHEYNAVAYHTKHPNKDEYLRLHTDKNHKQHKETLEAFKGYEDEWQMYIDWFKNLPICLHIDGLNIIHACWDQEYINLYDHKKLTDFEFLLNSSEKGSAQYGAVETLLKGKESEIGEGRTVPDKEGNPRSEIRTQWWLSEEQLTNSQNLLEVAVSIPENARESFSKLVFNYEERKGSFCGLPPGLTFIGHYWFTTQSPLITDKLCCLDFSCVKGGSLAAYRWSGEESLNEENVVKVKSLA